MILVIFVNLVILLNSVVAEADDSGDSALSGDSCGYGESGEPCNSGRYGLSLSGESGDSVEPGESV